jgi:ribonuclease P protein component
MVYYIKKYEEIDIIKYVIVCSRKVGNAVERNRIKRIVRVGLRDSYQNIVEKNIEKIIIIPKRSFLEKKSFEVTKMISELMKTI